MTKVINNQDRIAAKINRLELDGVEAVGDDGSVCIEVVGDRDRVVQVARIINDLDFDANGVGDGVQEGVLWINGREAGLTGIHDEVQQVVWDADYD